MMFPLFAEWTLVSKSTNERQNISKTELFEGKCDTGKLVYEVCLDGQSLLI